MSARPAEPPYLTARQAASELAITPASLYAYVSRGLIRSEAQPGSRSRRYRADDVRALKRQRAPAAAGKAGEAATPAVESAISTLAEDGPVYRGVRALPLAAAASLEQAATLLWGEGNDPFGADNLPPLSAAMRAVMAATAEAQPVARAVAVLALASEADPRAFHRSAEGRLLLGGRVLRLVAAAILGQAPAALPLHRQVAAAWAPGNPVAEELLRRALVLLADHELNASAYTVRCAASTGLTLYDAAVAGLVALKGPAHGGAGPLAAHMLADLATGDLAARVRARVALGEAFHGFGHPLYPQGDPRAADLLAALAAKGLGGEMTRRLPALVAEATGLRPNIDYALAVLMRSLEQPVGQEMALFAIARSAGWIAHALEQLADGRLIRPRARYTGPPPGRTAPR